MLGLKEWKALETELFETWGKIINGVLPYWGWKPDDLVESLSKQPLILQGAGTERLSKKHV